MPYFSIIIPTYNRGSLIGATLESVAAQQFDDYEVIVVDDGSTDGTLELLNNFPNIQVIRQANAGPGAARNRGVAAATGRYIAFLDSDDLFFPWTLSTYREIVESQGAPAFIAGRPFVFSNATELENTVESTVSFERFDDYFASSQVWPWFGVSSFVVRADVFRASGGFVEQRMNGEDADLTLRIGNRPGFIRVLGPATFGYRSHDNNITSVSSLNHSGVAHLVTQERAAHYPGGPARQQERRRIISRHARPHSLACLRSGQWRNGCELYLRSAAWNLRDARMRYLLAFPVFAVASMARSWWKSVVPATPKHTQRAERSDA